MRFNQTTGDRLPVSSWDASHLIYHGTTMPVSHKYNPAHFHKQSADGYVPPERGHLAFASRCCIGGSLASWIDLNGISRQEKKKTVRVPGYLGNYGGQLYFTPLGTTGSDCIWHRWELNSGTIPGSGQHFPCVAGALERSSGSRLSRLKVALGKGKHSSGNPPSLAFVTWAGAMAGADGSNRFPVRRFSEGWTCTPVGYAILPGNVKC